MMISDHPGDDELDDIIHQHRFDVEKIAPAEAFGKAKAALTRLIDKHCTKAEKTAFLAGAVYAGLLDEDASIILEAFDKWKAEQEK